MNRIMNCTQKVSDPFHAVESFEDTIAKFYGAKYGVATDCCTHAIECLRYEGYDRITLPEHTYISIPMTCEKLVLIGDLIIFSGMINIILVVLILLMVQFCGDQIHMSLELICV